MAGIRLEAEKLVAAIVRATGRPADAFISALAAGISAALSSVNAISGVGTVNSVNAGDGTTVTGTAADPVVGVNSTVARRNAANVFTGLITANSGMDLNGHSISNADNVAASTVAVSSIAPGYLPCTGTGGNLVNGPPYDGDLDVLSAGAYLGSGAGLSGVAILASPNTFLDLPQKITKAVADGASYTPNPGWWTENTRAAPTTGASDGSQAPAWFMRGRMQSRYPTAGSAYVEIPAEWAVMQRIVNGANATSMLDFTAQFGTAGWQRKLTLSTSIEQGDKLISWVPVDAVDTLGTRSAFLLYPLAGGGYVYVVRREPGTDNLEVRTTGAGTVLKVQDYNGAPAAVVAADCPTGATSYAYNMDGTLASMSDAYGTKTFGYAGGKLVTIVGTGIYRSKTFAYTGDALTGVTAA